MKKEKFGRIKKVNRKFGILLDTIKGIIIVIITFILIVCFASAIIHNLLRVGEISSKYNGKYKSLYQVDDKMMNIYSVGDNERTVIILPEVGTVSPVMEYKALADSLSNEYKVVIPEPLGYGYSLTTKDKRTNENIIKELREGLENAEIYGPYTLITFGNSSLYANYYSENYPEEVAGIVSINPVYSKSLDNDSFKDDYLPNLKNNIKFYSVISYSGIFRWGSFVKPDLFNIDKMQNSDSYDKEEIKIYRNLIANKFLTKPMRNEVYQLEDNMKELKKFKYPENLQVLQIITTDYRDEYSGREENIGKYAKDLISNSDIQIIRTIDGDISDYLFDSSNIKLLKKLISTYF